MRDRETVTAVKKSVMLIFNKSGTLLSRIRTAFSIFKHAPVDGNDWRVPTDAKMSWPAHLFYCLDPHKVPFQFKA